MTYEISSKDMALEVLFDGEERYFRIPDYQRAYEWRASEEVEELWEDLLEHLDDWRSSDRRAQYLLGQVIVHKTQDHLDVSDGQQRLTTLYLMISVLAQRCGELAAQDPQDAEDLRERQDALQKMLRTKKFIQGQVSYKVRLTDQKMSGSDLLEAAAKGTGVSSDDPELQTLARAYAHLTVLVEDLDTDVLANFITCLLTSVKVVLTLCGSEEIGVRVFIKLNDRGREVDLADKTKALLYEKAPGTDRPKVLEDWNRAMGEIRRSRVSNVNKFLLHYLHGVHFDSLKQEKEALKALKKQDINPLDFAAKTAASARSYRRVLEGKHPLSERTCMPLYNIANFSKLAAFKQHLPLLLCLQDLPEGRMNELCEELERLMFVFSMAGESPPQLAVLVNSLMDTAREYKKNQDEALWDHLLVEIREARDNRASAFRQGFLSATTESLRDSRYVLSRMEQYLDQVDSSQEGACTSQVYTTKSPGREVHVEHILAKSTNAQAAHAEFGPDWSEYVGHVANLMLLESTINTSLQEAPYSAKKAGYKGSKFWLACSMVEDVAFGSATGRTRMAAQLQQFDTWDSSALEARAELMYKLATKTWRVQESTEGDVRSSLMGSTSRKLPQAPARRLREAVGALAQGMETKAELDKALKVKRGDYFARAAVIAGLAEEDETGTWTLSQTGAEVALLNTEDQDEQIAKILDVLPIVVQQRERNRLQELSGGLAGLQSYSASTTGRRTAELNSWIEWVDSTLSS